MAKHTRITVCTPPCFLLGVGGLNLEPNFQKGGPDRSSTFRGGLLGKRGGGDFFRGGGGGGCNFHIKDKKKKFYKQQYFSLS